MWAVQLYFYQKRMAISSQEQKENRKFYVQIREGNRGGWSLFDWQSVREMPYRDREMYLGNSATIGVLDKGGKWRKRDWYLKSGKKYDNPELSSEQQEAIRRDQQRMKAALGITEVDDEQKLTEQEMQDLLKKIKKEKGDGNGQQTVGLGFDKSKVQIRGKAAKVEGANELAGFDELQEYQRAKSKEKKKKKQKKSKKQKKEKKNRKRERSSSNQKEERRRSRSRSHKKKHKKERKH